MNFLYIYPTLLLVETKIATCICYWSTFSLYIYTRRQKKVIIDNTFSQGLDDLLGIRTNIGIKRMGDLDQKPFINTCKQRYPLEEAQLEASTLCSLWQEHVKDSRWYPFKVVLINGNHQVCF